MYIQSNLPLVLFHIRQITLQGVSSKWLAGIEVQSREKSTKPDPEAISKAVQQVSIRPVKTIVVVITQPNEEGRRIITGTGQANT